MKKAGPCPPSFSAFTLVELIVVIAVLAVLAAISFSTVANITSGARDSARLTDISSIKTSLESYSATKGGYPLPDNAMAVTWSGNLAWSQGSFGETVVRVLNNINLPKDPKWQIPYSYSVTNSKKEYEIATVLEKATSFNGMQKVYAQGEQYEPYIKGNFNGVALRVSSALSTWILSIPTLIASDIKDAKVENIVFAYGKSGNVPFSYTGVVNSPQALATTWTPKQVWSGAVNTPTALPKTDSELQGLTTALQAAYTTSPAANSSTIKSLLAATDTKAYASTVVNNVGGNIAIAAPAAVNNASLGGMISLLHFDGNMTDVSGKIWTNVGGITTATEQSKFWGSSLKIDNTTEKLTISAALAPDFTFTSTQPWTVDAWVYTVAFNGYFNIFGYNSGGSAGSFALWLSNSANHILTYAPTGRIDSTPVWVSGVWHHVAWIYDGAGNSYLATDGVLVGTSTTSSAIPSHDPYAIGGSTSGDVWYIDELRVSGKALWTTFPFTPPTAPSS